MLALDGVEQQNNGKRLSRFAKFLTIFLPMVTALVTAFVALIETQNKASEVASKAAHDELVSKLESLNEDIASLDKKLRKQTHRLRQEVKFGVASAKAQADSVRALFTGYALASRGRGVKKTVDEVKKVVDASAERTKTMVESTPTIRAIPLKRSFKKPKSWKQIQEQVQTQQNTPSQNLLK